MAKKPHKNIKPGNGQKAVYQCKECDKIWMDDPKGVNDKKFCSEECKKHYNTRDKPELDKSLLEGKKDNLL